MREIAKIGCYLPGAVEYTQFETNAEKIFKFCMKDLLVHGRDIRMSNVSCTVYRFAKYLCNRAHQCSSAYAISPVRLLTIELP